MSTSKLAISHTSQGSVHLDALRGAAALLVFANHTRALYFTSPLAEPTVPLSSTVRHAQPVDGAVTQQDDASYGQVKLASEAVIIFFVLSGYLVGGSVLRAIRSGRWAWKAYLTKRLTRLYVVLLPAIIFGAALDYLGMKVFGPGSVYTTPPGINLVTTFDLAARLHPLVLLGNSLFLENILVPYIGTNVAIWSLANEFWYYIVFPFISLAVFSRRQPWLRCLWALIACGILLFIGPGISKLFPVWILGALVSLLPKTITVKQARVLSAGGAVLLLISMFAVRLIHIRLLVADYLVAVVSSLFLYVVVHQTQPARESLYKAVAGFFSRISYTLYLFHVPMAVFLCGLLNSPWHAWPKTPRNLALYALGDLFLVGCAYVLWCVFEANTDRVRAWIFERHAATHPKITIGQ